MRALSKSKLMAWRQCPRRLWLEIHRPECRADPAANRMRVAVGDLVGELARALYDPDDNGVLIDVQGEGPAAGVRRTAELLDRRVPIFEAGLEGSGARAFVDVLRPVRRGSLRAWELIEVKSSAGLKAAHRDDVAVQSFVADASGLTVAAVKLAHVDTSFVYRGDHDYQGLLREVDLTGEAQARRAEVAGWVAAAQAIAELPEMPAVLTGLQCRTPHPCGFLALCRTREPPVEFPVAWLPRLQGELRRQVESRGLRDLRELPRELLSPEQLRVLEHTLRQEVYFDRYGALDELAGLQGPQVFLDFEAVQLAVPIWAGAHPYQMFPFQFSLHLRDADGSLVHRDYLDLSGDEPRRAFAEALVALCPPHGTVFVWNAAFERARVAELAALHDDLRPALRAIEARMVDLLAIAARRYYHPAQRGSWKLKRILPTIAPEVDHARLAGVQDGHMAMLAYIEAIQPDTAPERRLALRQELLAYCRLDTLALVRIWSVLSGQDTATQD